MVGGIQELTVAHQYSDRVVGTVSEFPGFIMNDTLLGDFVTIVAYIGRVPCRVEGTITKGELLVVGPTPGVAISSEGYDIGPGKIVGRALENHDGPESLIEILVGKY